MFLESVFCSFLPSFAFFLCLTRTGTLGAVALLHSVDGDTEFCLENNQSVDGDTGICLENDDGCSLKKQKHKTCLQKVNK